MQTIQLQIEDNKVDQFLNIIDNLKDGIVKNFTVSQDDTLNKSTIKYMKTKQFKKNKKYFQKCLEDIESGKSKLVPFEFGLDELDSFIDEISDENSKAS